MVVHLAVHSALRLVEQKADEMVALSADMKGARLAALWVVKSVPYLAESSAAQMGSLKAARLAERSADAKAAWMDHPMVGQ